MANRGATREAWQAVQRRALPSVRSFVWRVLGPPPKGARPARPAPPPTATRGTNERPWSGLRKHGLRVEPGFGLYADGSKGITVHFEPPAQLNNTSMQMYRPLRIGRYTFMRSGIVRFVDEIGRYTSIGPGVILGEGEHPIRWLTTSPSTYNRGRWSFYPPDADAPERLIKRDRNIDPATERNITIGHDVWIGANVMVRRGVTIGDGAVVAGGAFVNRDVEPYSIVGGTPAKVLSMRFDEQTIARLQAVRWWEFDISDLAGVDFADVDAALTEIEAREAAGTISRVPPQFNSVRLKNDGYTSLKLHQGNTARAQARLARLRNRGS